MQKKIAYQGVEGAYSEQACKNAYSEYSTLACDTFQEAMWMVESGDADLAMIPLENSTAGRVEEIYRLIPKMALHVIGEHFEPVVHCLLGLPSATLKELEYVASHPQALAQCHNNIIELGNALEVMSNEVFNHHVNDGKNDFATWLEDVHGEGELAASLIGNRNKDQHCIKIMKFIINDLSN